MTDLFEKNIANIKTKFSKCNTPNDRYKLIIFLGSQLPIFDENKKADENLIKGCQSILYFYGNLENDHLYFAATSEALVSKGLAAILIEAYNGLTPKEILQSPPDFLDEIGLDNALSPHRSNGLYQMYIQMKRLALKHFEKDNS